MRPMPGMDVLSFGAAVLILLSFLHCFIYSHCQVQLYLSNLIVRRKLVQMLPRIIFYYLCEQMWYRRRRRW